jgi:hypothetical protein
MKYDGTLNTVGVRRYMVYIRRSVISFLTEFAFGERLGKETVDKLYRMIDDYMVDLQKRGCYLKHVLVIMSDPEQEYLHGTLQLSSPYMRDPVLLNFEIKQHSINSEIVLDN